MTLVNLQLNGAALFHWFEFAKKNDIWSNAIKVEKDTDEKNGAVKYKAPVYELSGISDEDDIEAGKLQTEIESYLKEYYAKNRASNPAPKVDENQNNGLNAKPAAKKAESKPKVDEKEEEEEVPVFDPNEEEDDSLPF